MNNQYKKDIITCYESVWTIYNKIPTVELVLEAYKEMKDDEVVAFAIDFYNDVGCYGEADRVNELGLNEIDYDRVGFEEDSCATDIDVVLEEELYTFERKYNEIVNSSLIYLFGKEW